MPTNSKDYVEVNVGRWVVYGILAIILLIILFGSFYTIQPGERGVLITFGKPSMEAIGEGLHFKYPIAQTVKKLDVKTVKIEEVADAASKDLQDVQISVTLNYHIMPSLAPKLYQEVGKTYEDTVIRPAIQDSIKATSALYNAENQLIKRPEIRQGVKEDLQARLEQFHIVVDDVSITNFQFSEQFDNAIEAKQVAEQDAQRAERELTKVKLEAEQKIALANAEAESLRLQKNEITPTLLQLRAIEVEKIKWERWNGQLPTTVLGDSSGVLPFYNVNNVAPV